MIVVSNTSPINYLVLIDEVEVLPALFGRVVIPVSVFDELRAPDAPVAVRRWLDDPPDWLELRRPKSPPDVQLALLGSGERDAILLAQELHADALMIDDYPAYLEANRRHIPTVRTLAVLDRAAERGLIDLPSVFARLRQTNFRMPREVVQALLEQDKARDKVAPSSSRRSSARSATTNPSAPPQPEDDPGPER